MSKLTPTAAYIHIPFCRHRCGYCNFTLIAGKDHLIDQYLDALSLEFETIPAGTKLDTLFIGGGTPSHLSLKQTERLLEMVQRRFVMSEGAEFTIEANPHDLESSKCAILADHGVTRLSVGAQSFESEKLRLLERDHDALQIERGIEISRQYFSSISLDLMFGTPNETLLQWKQELTRAINLELHHVSTYELTIEKGTQFWNRSIRGELSSVDQDLGADMYLMAIEMFSGAEVFHYEVSNFARDGHRCRHNESYWKGDSYFGLGAGASSYIDGTRSTNHRSTTTYIKRIRNAQSPVTESEQLSVEDSAREKLVFGLRRVEGIAPEEFSIRTGFTIDQLAGEMIDSFVSAGYMERTDEQLKLTQSGLMISDALLPELL